MTVQSTIKTNEGIANLKEAGKDFKNAAKSEVNHAAEKATDIATSLGEKVGSKIGEYAGDAEHYFDKASSAAKKWTGQVEDRVQERPISSILATLGFGVVLGMLLRK